MLYDDSEQLEVRHVVSLAHHTIDVYGGGDKLSEGDLWIKRNCIRLTRKDSASKNTPASRPFYFFSDNCSEKEDFYHALLLSQSAAGLEDAPPRPQPFDTRHMLKLVQQLHAPDADIQSRWLNAVIGRVFLAMYKTDHVENFIRAKINRKIARVPKPNFITSIQIQDIDMGDSGPLMSNFKLKELNVNGDMVVEADIKYNGGFKLQMGAVARIDLGTRLKARQVSLIMAGTLRKLSGHLLIRVKPPPSNRFWITFETMPHIEMSIEPVVSSRQITYGIILRAIESRIREVIGETLVFPNWDDSPFLDTSNKEYRGGIFHAHDHTVQQSEMDPVDTRSGALDATIHELTNNEHSDDGDPVMTTLRDSRQKTTSMPSLFEPVQKLSLRKTARKPVAALAGDNAATATGTSTAASTPTQAATSPPLLPRRPKTMRSGSFATVATPLVSVEGASAEATRQDVKSKRNSRGAFDLVKEVNLRSQVNSSPPTVFTPEQGQDNIPHFDVDKGDALATEPTENIAERVAQKLVEDLNIGTSGNARRLSEPLQNMVSTDWVDPDMFAPRSPSTSSIPFFPSKSPSRTSSEKSASQSAPSPSQLSTAASVAKKWGWNVLNRQSGPSSPIPSPSIKGVPFNSDSPHDGLSNDSVNTQSRAVPSSSPYASQPAVPHQGVLRAATFARREPIGRGQPLPPPGTPLPGPQKSLWSSSSLSLGMGSLKRKPVPTPGPALPPRPSEQQVHRQQPQQVDKKQPPPLPARKQPRVQQEDESLNGRTTVRDGARKKDTMLVVAAPEDWEDEDHGSLKNSLDISVGGFGVRAENASAVDGMPESAMDSDEASTETRTQGFLQAMEGSMGPRNAHANEVNDLEAEPKAQDYVERILSDQDDGIVGVGPGAAQFPADPGNNKIGNEAFISGKNGEEAKNENATLNQ